MELYMMNRPHGRMILESVENGSLIWPTIEENGVTRPRKYSELTPAYAIQADCDERECKLYDEFDKFTYKKGETLDFYLRFSLLLNDMNIYNVKLEQIQVNTKFLNTLPPEWSKFVTDVKLQGDDPIDAINHMMSFLSAVVTSRYPTTNNQLRNSSNRGQQATINDGRVTLQPVLLAGSKDRPPMLAPGNYVQWKSRIKRYIDTKPNHELIHYCHENPPYELGWKDKEVLTSEGSLVTRTKRVKETYKNISQDIRDQLNAEAEAVQIILT
uniref:Integrase, catalytic region, zinc finger, CCHC-type, peptidase aspartic, catalytic n=1 Tax=Tanacetum cinerariifolium TaxID=118510 RepID=A0A699HPX6_TANCI|nr:hypothetical protein [Tanacetum cinerariifolium]